MTGSDHLQATNAGLAALEPWEPLPTGATLVDYWLWQLGVAERTILQVLLRRTGRR